MATPDADLARRDGIFDAARDHLHAVPHAAVAIRVSVMREEVDRIVVGPVTNELGAEDVTIVIGNTRGIFAIIIRGHGVHGRLRD